MSTADAAAPRGADDASRTSHRATAATAPASATADAQDSNTEPGRESKKAPSLLPNVLFNWAGEAVRWIGGFLLPRLINHRMSQAELGIWDYGWSIRSYIALAGAGLGSAGGHYVARYQGRWPELNRTLGGMLGLVLYGTGFSALAMAALAYLTPRLVNSQSAVLLADATSLVLSMGLAACVSMPTLVFAGVLVGNGRFDLLNLVDALSDAFLVMAILLCVLSDAGLKLMGGCVLGREVLNGIVKYMLARQISPEISVRPRWADWAIFREILGFSIKTLVEAVSKLLQYHVGVLVIAAVIGPAALALYSRPRALILTTTRFVMGFARVLVPEASALHDRHAPNKVGDLLIRSTRYGLYLTLPPVLVLLILGPAIMYVWMGDQSYAASHVLPILAIGYLPLFAQQPTYHILLGLASHGLAGTASLIGSAAGALMSIFFVAVLHWGIDGAALATAIPVFVVNLCVLPYAGCRAARISLVRYARETLLRPLQSAIPFAIVLLTARIVFAADPMLQLVCGFVGGLPVLATVYWFTAVPVSVKHQILRRMPLA